MTPAELHVASLAASGLSNADIARTRATSVRTVANQMASILRGLGVSSRHALALHADLMPFAPSEPRLANWNGLRSREKEILARACAGAQQKAIALDLGVTPSTVSATLHRLRRRGDFKCLAEMVRAFAAARSWMDCH